MLSGSKVMPMSSLKAPKANYHSRSAASSVTSLINAANNAAGETDFTKWVQQNIKRRECDKFVAVEEKKKIERQKTFIQDPTAAIPPVPGVVNADLTLNDKNRDPLCHCGYKKSKHSRKAKENGRGDSKEWKVNEHTTSNSNDAYGEMEFEGYGQRMSKYIRVDHKTQMEHMLLLLTKQWRLKKPNLLISVTGGAKNFTMRPRLKEVFRKGLMKAAESTGAWIITGGMNAGVMKHVGEAIRENTVVHGVKNQIVALGISPWGCVNGKEALVEHRGKGLWPAKYKSKDSQRRQSPLDPNHSHFILVDNGTQHKFGTEIAFRATLESSISNSMKTSTNGESAVSIPVVCVVLEGGPGTLETVKSAIQNGTPAVIVEGSGRAADVLAYAYANSYEEEVEVTDKSGKIHKKVIPVFDNDLFEKVKQKIIAEWKSDKDIDSRVTWVRECLEKRNHMTVFQLDGSNSAKDIDLAILQALLKVNKDNDVDQLRLALAWNRIDIAKSDIFTDESNLEPGDLDEVMFTAITSDCKDFVELFMENGVSFKDFLTVRKLLQLYNNLPSNSLLRQLLKKKQSSKRTEFSLADVGHVISDLTGDYYHPLYLRAPYKELNCAEILRESPSRRPSNASLEEEEEVMNVIDAATGEENTPLLVTFDEPVRELFIWSVLNNRLDMAMLFWEEGKEGIAAALTAQKILKSMRSKTDDSELEKEILIQEEYFGRLAVGVLSECYATDERRARHVLVRELPMFGLSTCVQLAVEADNKKFIAHAACQSLLNNIWMGRMNQDTGLIRIWTCMVLPFLIFPLIIFQPETHLNVESGNSYETDSSPVIANGDAARPQTAAVGVRRNEVKPSLKRDQSGLKWYKKVIHFFNAPSVTFYYNCVSYMFFLFLYSTVLLVEFTADIMFPAGNIKFSPWEILLIVWIGSLLVEEIRQIVMVEASTVRLKFRSYVTDVWNILDMIALITFMAGIILRVLPIDTCTNQSCFVAARIIYGLNLMTFFFRVLHMFSVHKQLGPKLVMIGQMMVDLCFFVVILMVFVSAYGIATQAIMYPGSELNITLVKNVLQRPYFQIYGELFLEEIEGEACPASGCSEPTSQWVVPIMLGVYILITNVLMLNLVIAMFSYTFSKIQDRTDEHWKYQRYNLVKEYYDRPPLAPPLILLSHIFFIMRFMLQKCCKRCMDVSNVFKMSFNEMDIRQLVLWENMYADEYLRHTQASEQASQELRIQGIDTRVESIAQQVGEMAEVSLMMQTGSQQQTSSYKLPPVLDDRLTYLEEQLQRTAKALNWIIDSMVENKLGSKQGKPELPDIDTLREAERQKREDVMLQKKREFEEMLKRQLELHIKSRNIRYPVRTEDLVIQRTPVTDEKVSWEVEWSDYEPRDFTDPAILQGPRYADIDLQAYSDKERPKLPFNGVDEKYKVSRSSFCGVYQVKNGIPLNPKGRTGLCGRGVLGRWGPNHAGDPIVTRWMRNNSKEIVREGGKPVLQFVSIQRSDNKEWAIPGGILEGCEDVHQCLKAEFEEEAMGNQMSGPEAGDIMMKLDRLWQTHTEIYTGYADDPRNTDNAWLETQAINYHDEDGAILNDLKLRPGNNVESIRWQQISSRQPLYGGHLNILQKVAEKHTAAF